MLYECIYSMPEPAISRNLYRPRPACVIPIECWKLSDSSKLNATSIPYYYLQFFKYIYQLFTCK